MHPCKLQRVVMEAHGSNKHEWRSKEPPVRMCMQVDEAPLRDESTTKLGATSGLAWQTNTHEPAVWNSQLRTEQ
jgi:hypothetical protein